MTHSAKQLYGGTAKRIGAWFTSVKKYAFAHKFISAIVIVVLLGGGWWVYGKATAAHAETRYVLGNVEKGTIISTVSGSGQVSASRQLDIKPEVSGKLIYIGVKPGQKVQQGALIAEVDPTSAQKALRDAQNNLETAKLTLEKLQKPVTGLSLIQAQNAVTSAQDSLTKTYSDSESDIVAAFLALPDIMSGLQNIVIGTTASHGSQWNIDYYRDASANYDSKAFSYRDDAYNTYITAKAAYDKTFADYQAAGNSPSTATIESLAAETNDMLKTIAAALKSSNSFIQFYSDTITNHNQNPSSVATAAIASLGSYISTATNQLSALSGDTTSIKTGKQNIIEKTQSLADLTDGPDDLDVRSDQLTIQQRQDAVTDAQDTLAKYYVRAPFAGTITAVNAYVGDDAGTAAVASIITPQQIVELSLNEVDAAKVKVGNKATLTFDAIDDLSLTGSVAQVDSVGAVSQGVVSYKVQISLDTQDVRVKPGMTVNASIQTDVHTDVLTVPSSAVKTTNGVSVVQVFTPPLADTGGTAGVVSKTLPVPVQVTTGISDDTNIEILSGLTEGEQVVTRTISGTAAAATTRTTTTNRGGFGGGAAPAGAAIRL